MLRAISSHWSERMAVVATMFWIMASISVSGCFRLQGNGEAGVQVDFGLEEHNALVRAVTPYMKVVGDENPRLEFDENAARANGLEENAIAFANEAVTATRDVLSKWLAREKSSETSFRHRWTSWDAWFEAMADTCNHVRSRVGPFRDRSATEQALRNAGYHPTRIPGQSYDANDWTRAVEYSGIPMQSGHAWSFAGAYRYHARMDGDRYYTMQGSPTPEPNPEFHTYIWPAWWWVMYAQWWHEEYC